MSREIKFRGISIDSRYSTEEYFLKMVYGQLINRYGDLYILMADGFEIEVDGETVGQYTGLKDKNEKEIYEGDIIELTWADKRTSIKYIVKYVEDCAYYMLECVTDEYELDTFCGYSQEQLEVIGNIYENPELLVGEE